MIRKFTSTSELIDKIRTTFDSVVDLYLICFDIHSSALVHFFLVIFGKLILSPYSDYLVYLIEEYPSPYFEAGYGKRKCLNTCYEIKNILQFLGYNIHICDAYFFGVIDLHSAIRHALCRCIKELKCEEVSSYYE